MRVQPRATQPFSGPRALGAVILVPFVLDQCQALKLAQCRLIAGPRLREPAGCEHRPSRNFPFPKKKPTGMAGEVRVEKRQRNADSQRFDRSAWTRWEHRQPNAHAGHVLAHILLSRVFRRLPGSSCVRPLRLSGRSLPMSRQMRANSWAPRMHYPAQRAGVKSAPHRTEAHAR